MKLFSITKEYRLSLTYLKIRFFGIKISVLENSFLGLFLQPFIKSNDFGKNNKVFIIKNEVKKEINLKKIKGLCINFFGNNNTIILHKPCTFLRSDILFQGDNSTIEIGKNFQGKIKIMSYGQNANLKIGENNYICDLKVLLNGNKLEIGNGCLISNNVEILTDCHSVLYFETKELLNKALEPIKIGNYVWIGQNVTMTKNTQIPNNCIIGINSTVTKKFEKENCIIAGNPAKIVKENITWDKKSPTEYQKTE